MRTDRKPPLREVRRARGISLREVARTADIDPTHLSRAERGQARLSLAALYRVAKALDLRELAGFLELYVREEKSRRSS